MLGLLFYGYQLLAQTPSRRAILLRDEFGGGPVGPVGGGPVGPVGGGFTQDLPNPLGIYTIPQLVDRIVGLLVVIAVPIVALMVIYGAFLIMTSAGNSAKYKKGGLVIFWAAAGFAILLLANGVTSLVESLLWGY